MKWEEYYDRFWDWAESTKISRVSSLTDFTSSAEVVEIANEFFDEKIGSRLVKRALDQGIRFSPSEIIELGSCVTDDVFYEEFGTVRGDLPQSSTRNWKVFAAMKISSMPSPGKMASGVKWMTCPFNRRLPLRSQ